VHYFNTLKLVKHLKHRHKTADHRTTYNRNISNLIQITDLPSRNHTK